MVLNIYKDGVLQDVIKLNAVQTGIAKQGINVETLEALYNTDDTVRAFDEIANNTAEDINVVAELMHVYLPRIFLLSSTIMAFHKYQFELLKYYTE